MQAYTQCIPGGHPENEEGRHIKSLVHTNFVFPFPKECDTAFTLSRMLSDLLPDQHVSCPAAREGLLARSPHHFRYVNDTYAVNTLFQRVNGPRSKPITYAHIALHHYILKSKQVMVFAARYF